MNSSSKLILSIVLMGILIGVAMYTFIYAKGWSYLTNNPETCANCHIMQPQYDGWIHSSHRNNIGCNSCHTPSDFIGKWYTKASNGFWHSFYFTSGTFHEPIQITKRSLKITEKRCQQCHEALTLGMHGGPRAQQNGRWCTRCHSNVGHQH
jgi:cytochrome c nitrite reductase small subunit